MASAIPEGLSTITPFLNLVGAADAIAFYQKAFGAEIVDRVDLPDGRVGGTRRGVATHLEDVSADELRRRAASARG